jgi:tetratricopeptide (TPR) repeat protein/transcriptional regulator with XRE-family HTH domain
VRGDGPVPEQPVLSFAGLLRQLRDDAGLTQEELAEAAGLSHRSISDLERGVNLTARHDTARLLAGALGLTGPQRALFEAAARGRTPAGQVLAAGESAAAAAATRTLPRDIASFTGRVAELAQLADAVTAATAAGGGVVGIHAIGGMAGIGKTTFAVHAAHRLAGAFPDGQFFLPLHAHTPGQRPVEPVDALASLLLSAGVGAQQIPPGLQARAGRWRDYLAGKKVLLLLDDAASHEQVTPLLPGTAGSLVLITSRRHLTALEDAAAISLDTLTPGEATALLARLAGRPGLGSGHGPAGEIIRLCGYLPLAVGMLARQLHHHPAWTAADLAAELAAAADRLELMRAENVSVAAAFDLSYQDLDPGQQRLFRHLGVHPGADIDAYAAAALDGTDLAAARRRLNGLYDHYLLAEPARGRYRLHDLLREHARSLAFASNPADSDAAARRLLDYYLHTASAAAQHIERRNAAAARPPPGEPPAVAPQLSTASRASAWLDAERANLDAAVGYAAGSGRPGHVIAIPAAIAGFLSARGYWDQSAALLQAALAAADQAGDRAGQADALNELGILQGVTGDYPAAAASHRQALELYRGLGDRLGQASALDNLGRVQHQTGDYRAAAANHRQALAIFRDIDHQVGQALAMTNRGNAQARTGEYPAAAASHQQSLAIFRDIGHRLGQALATGNLGTVQIWTGDYRGAAASLAQALGTYRDIGDRLGQAYVLNNMGEVQARTGDYLAAATSQEQALGLFRDLGDRGSQATVIRNRGALQLRTGDYPAAAASLTQALDICAEVGDRGGQARVLNDLGKMMSGSGDGQQARDHHVRALAIAREISAPLEEARALEGLGHCLLQDGDLSAAAAHWQQALAICQRIGVPDAHRIQETLHQHGVTTAPPSPSSQRRQPTTPAGQ